MVTRSSTMLDEFTCSERHYAACSLFTNLRSSSSRLHRQEQEEAFLSASQQKVRGVLRTDSRVSWETRRDPRGLSSTSQICPLQGASFVGKVSFVDSCAQAGVARRLSWCTLDNTRPSCSTLTHGPVCSGRLLQERRDHRGPFSIYLFRVAQGSKRVRSRVLQFEEQRSTAQTSWRTAQLTLKAHPRPCQQRRHCLVPCA